MASNSAFAGAENKQQLPSPRNLGRSWTSSSVTCEHGLASSAPPKCVCAPATHAGSFKCRLHRVNSHGHSAPAAPRQPSATATANRTVEAS
ncbi:hypothetical protein KFK09_011204 [Dendrobium nobile]|uniref:Uncharacterized protein n=1 Tax=Dendrobium nobile TaxID=94219 RepID=A0A8T3BC72_DENNO|nr:hypothetical protein KFK09_011204 [Dendrobium nobile]